MTQLLCIDIGGTSIKYALYDSLGNKLVGTEQVPTFGVYDTVMDSLLNLVSAVTNEHKIDGIAISSAGVVDWQTGEIVYSGYTIPRYTGTRIKETLETTYGIPCEVENDVNAACLGEYWQGAAKGKKSAFCLTVGTGIGGAFLYDDHIVHGVSNSAAEIGYLNIENQRFQDLASTTSLVAYVNNHASTDYPDGRAVFDGALAGEQVCIDGINRMVNYLSIGISSILYLLNPEVLVLGGGIMAQKEVLHDKIKVAVEKQMESPQFLKTDIVFAQHKNDAGMLGALYHFNTMQNG